MSNDKEIIKAWAGMWKDLSSITYSTKENTVSDVRFKRGKNIKEVHPKLYRSMPDEYVRFAVTKDRCFFIIDGEEYDFSDTDYPTTLSHIITMEE